MLKKWRAMCFLFNLCLLLCGYKRCEDDVLGAWKGLFCVAIALLLERKPMGFAPKVAE